MGALYARKGFLLINPEAVEADFNNGYIFYVGVENIAVGRNSYG